MASVLPFHEPDDELDDLNLDLLEAPARRPIHSGDESLPVARCLQIFRLMVRTRALEERAIRMSKSGEAFFWIGGPGEEAFNSVLGLQFRKGKGPMFDYFYPHYRNAATMLAMGMPMVDHFRQIAMTATDPWSKGRNFVGHYADPDWNVLPKSSVLSVQYAMAPGTALMQKRAGGNGVSIVLGGDAGTASGDFASCMIWSTRPGNELPVLMLVTNNGYGISTPANSQHGERRIVDRGEPFGIPGEAIDGNDPIACWHAMARALRYCRRLRRPWILEAQVSRLNGHSSSSGATREGSDPDPLSLFEDRLRSQGAIYDDQIERMRQEAADEADEAARQALSEPRPTAADVRMGTYAPSTVDAVYPGDYTGLPK